METRTRALAERCRRRKRICGSNVKYMRTRLTLPVDRWLEIRDQRGIELVELLESSSANSPFVRVYSDFLFWDNSLKAKQLTSTIIHDMVRLVLAIALIFAFMWFYFDYNLALAILAVSQVVPSFPIMAFIVDVVLRQRPLSIFAGCSLFVVTGVSSDNIFVVHETWQRAHALRIDGKRASTAHRVRWTLSQAATPLFIADVTTAVSLVVNGASPLPAFSSLACVAGSHPSEFCSRAPVHVPSSCPRGAWLLAFRRLCLAFHKEGTTHGAGSSRTRLRFQHYVHGALFKARRWLLAATFILVAWLLPASYRLLMKRTGGKVNLLGEVSEPPPGNLEWLGTLTSSGGALQLTPVPLACDWPILFHRIRGGIASLDAPLITHNLWPGGASALSALLYIDAFAAAAYACRRIAVGKRALDPTGREVRARRRDLALYAVALLSLLLCAGATLVLILQRNPTWTLNTIGCNAPKNLSATLATCLALHAIAFGAAALRLFLNIRLTLGNCLALIALGFTIAFGLVVYYTHADAWGNDEAAREAALDTASQINWRPVWQGACLAWLLCCWGIYSAIGASVFLEGKTRSMLYFRRKDNPDENIHYGRLCLILSGMLGTIGALAFFISGLQNICSPRVTQAPLGMALLLSVPSVLAHFSRCMAPGSPVDAILRHGAHEIARPPAPIFSSKQHW